jgi:uncharacterized protein YciU (UPF0263 family)
MAILKFRVYLEEDDSVYRDIAIRHTQKFFDLHEILLKSFEFDNKHKATFYRSNDHWQQGREISLDVYENEYKVPPLLMKETALGTEIRDTNQKFVYRYDFNKSWMFLIELINVSKEENPKISYPAIVRTEGIGPSQYGTKSLLGDKFADVEEKYDLSKGAEGFSDKDADGEDFSLGEEGVAEEGAEEGPEEGPTELR